MNVVAHNLLAMNSSRQFKINENRKAKTTEKLASGYRINRAADDAAGLAISEKMRWQIRGLNKGAENINSGISLMQVADGALSEVDEMLHRMTELSVQAANGTYTYEDRQSIQDEINQLAAEITRIGKTTTYNELRLFDDIYGLETAPVTSLVTCPAAESGHLTEAYKVGSTWYPSASMDFSNINENNIGRLNGKGFSFNCSASCNEAFSFTMFTDGTPSSASNLSGKVQHDYIIDISGCRNGTDIVNTLYNYVANHMPNGYTPSADSLLVSHSNVIRKDPTNPAGLILHAVSGYETEFVAKNKFKNATNKYGGIDCSQLTGTYEEDKINEIRIQCSSDIEDYETIWTHRMNANILGVSNLSVLSESAARTSISDVKNALGMIARHRSELGAFQNRLEHAYNTNANTAENTTAAESRIRDADMAKLVMDQSMESILEQANVAMMAQANQSNSTVLSMLQ